MLPHNLLGNTGILVSAIGLGTVKFGRNQKVNYPSGFELPDHQTLQNLLRTASELGINLLDTAPAYGVSEEKLGELLKGQRHNWVISTKAGEDFLDGKSFYDFSAAGIKNSIERSLQRLQTDYLDIVLIHSNGDDVQLIEQQNVFSTLAELKQSGHIRAYGMSTKTVAGGLLALQQSDLAMVTYNPIQQDEQAVIAYAHAHQKGIFIKKALASGHLDKMTGEDPVKTALQFIFQQPGVTSVILGTLNAAHLTHNVNCLRSASA